MESRLLFGMGPGGREIWLAIMDIIWDRGGPEASGMERIYLENVDWRRATGGGHDGE